MVGNFEPEEVNCIKWTLMY